MTSTTRLAFDVSATGPDLHLDAVLDGIVIWSGYPNRETETVCFDFDDTADLDHALQFIMTGKQPEHTRVNDTGDIIEDRYIQITNLSFDEIQIDHIFFATCKYYHDYNGSTESVVDEFYGVMGCNGRVEMPFSTPIYLWLLENM